jgi:hypothetical protein
LESGLRVNVASVTFFPPTEKGSTARIGVQFLALPGEEEELEGEDVARGIEEEKAA